LGRAPSRDASGRGIPWREAHRCNVACDEDADTIAHRVNNWDALWERATTQPAQEAECFVRWREYAAEYDSPKVLTQELRREGASRPHRIAQLRYSIWADCLEALATAPEPAAVNGPTICERCDNAVTWYSRCETCEGEPAAVPGLCASGEVCEAVRAWQERQDCATGQWLTDMLDALRTATLRPAAQVRADALREAADKCDSEAAKHDDMTADYSAVVSAWHRAAAMLRALAEPGGEGE
jgi:hypothetical protein